MSTQPPKAHLRYGELREWLRANGISEYKLTSLISLGIIKAYSIGGGRAFYNAAQVEREVLKRLADNER